MMEIDGCFRSQYDIRSYLQANLEEYNFSVTYDARTCAQIIIVNYKHFEDQEKNELFELCFIDRLPLGVIVEFRDMPKHSFLQKLASFFKRR